MANSHGVTASRADYMARVEILVTTRCIRIVLGDLKNYTEQCQTSGKQIIDEVLTAVNVFRSLLLLLASVVLSGLLDGKTSFGTCSVEVALIVHGFLERVAFPTEDVVAVCSSTARSS